MNERYRDDMPLGHSVSAHTLFGRCSYCATSSVYHELESWRVWALLRLEELETADLLTERPGDLRG